MDLVERLVSYCHDILDGNIKACKKHKQAIKRFMRDLEKSQDESYPYEFEPEEVVNFYEWAKMFVHSKGSEDIIGKPIELTPFQLFIVSNIFGWKHKKTGNRRYKRSYVQLGRKNAKSQLLSLMASYECFLSGQKAEVYIAGWGRIQSNVVYEETLFQIRRCKLLEGKFSDSYHRITHLKSESIIMALSRESKNLDGLNPSLSIIDEYHCHPTDEILQVLSSGMVRPNAHLCIITTAGLNLNSPCYHEYQYVSKILDEDNPVENEEYFVFITELDIDEGDDIKDESVWIKSNPLQATFEDGMDSLRGKLRIALDLPEKMRDFLTKNMNIWVDMKPDGYLPLNKWKECEDTTLTLEDMRGLPCIVGVDLSAKLDLTSVAFLFLKEDILYVFSHSFMPEDTLEQKRKTDKVPYELWVKQGWMTMTNGGVVDYNYVEHYIIEMEQQYGFVIREICADPWNATQFLSNFNDKGYTVVEIRQGIQTLGAPTKNFRERVFAKTLKHNGSPVLTWCIGNAVTRMDANENIMLDKSKSTQRIDAIAAVIVAHVRTDSVEVDLNSLILSDDWSF